MTRLPEPCDAYLFDLDGTLVDTMPLHYRAYAEVFRENGLELSYEAYAALVGAPARIAIPHFLAAAGQNSASEDEVAQIHSSKKATFERILTSEKPSVLPAAALLERVRATHPCGLVSSGNRQGVLSIVARMGWGDWFQAVVTGDDVARGKPDPEPFLLAARMLGVAAGSCLAFEDTEDGLKSARAAGMTVIDVTKACDLLAPGCER